MAKVIKRIDQQSSTNLLLRIKARQAGQSGIFSPPVCRSKHIAVIGMIILLMFAVPALSFGAVRVGIVYSDASANQFFDRFSYSQLFMAMQHQAMMAGIPFDVLSENDLISGANLTDYSALIILPMQYAANETAVITALTNASQSGVGIITGGILLSAQAMEDLLGVRYTGWIGDMPAVVNAGNVSHPVMRHYQTNEQIIQYATAWLNFYEPVEPANSTILANASVNGEVHGAVFATVHGGRNVYFVNDQIMGDTNLVWQALRWVVYGDNTPVGIKMGRNRSIFVSRNDMDSSMYFDGLAATDIPLLDLLETWKQRYNFVGSYYINIGNNPAAGEYTDWSVSTPLFHSYLQLGNEIGTHSYTHPDFTTDLTAAQLEFEFNQSMLEIEANLGIEVTGAAIPGNPETLEVDGQLNPYFEYISGRYSNVGSGYPGAFGYLTPDYSMLYFSLNLSPDYTLIEWLGNTPAQATQIWADQYAALMSHASQPIVHWLWHDYGPTEGTAGGLYSVAMYEDTIAMASSNGSEFATADDIQKRIMALQSVALDVTENDVITADISAADIGQFSLELDSDRVIANVDGWYAYDDDQVFMPQNGGRFVIHQGTTPSQVTHIVSLPMRSKLISLTGDGNALEFSFNGEGIVAIELNPAVVDHYQVQGADGTTLSGNTLQLQFNQSGIHSAAVTYSAPTNHAPQADAQSLSTAHATPVAISLTASDMDGNTLIFAVASDPVHGVLSGTTPNLTYTPNDGFSGTDSFTFTANDGIEESAPATISIAVASVVDPGDNTTPVDGGDDTSPDDIKDDPPVDNNSNNMSDSPKDEGSSGSSACFISTLF
jgi:serralysin